MPNEFIVGQQTTNNNILYFTNQPQITLHVPMFERLFSVVKKKWDMGNILVKFQFWLVKKQQTVF